MIGHKSLLTLGTVLCRHIHTSVFPEHIQHQQIPGRTGTQQEGRLTALQRHLRPHIEQRRHTHASANQQYPLFLLLRHRKAIAQRQQTVQLLASLQLCQPAGAVAHNRYQQPKHIGFCIHEID